MGERIVKKFTPAEVAKEIGCAERRVREIARRIGACRILGKTMFLMQDDVAAILEAIRCSPSTAEGRPSGSVARLPDGGYTEALARLTGTSPNKSGRTPKPASGNVLSMEPRRS